MLFLTVLLMGCGAPEKLHLPHPPAGFGLQGVWSGCPCAGCLEGG